MIVARQANIGEPGAISFDVVGNHRQPGAAGRIGPGCEIRNETRAGVIPRRGHGERRDVVGPHRPGAVSVVGALAQGPPGGTPRLSRYRAGMVGGFGEAQVDGCRQHPRSEMAGTMMWLVSVTPTRSTRCHLWRLGAPTCSKIYVWAVPPIFATNATVAPAVRGYSMWRYTTAAETFAVDEASGLTQRY